MLVWFSVLFNLAAQSTYSMSGVVWNFTYYCLHTYSCQCNKMALKHEFFLKYQKPKSSNKQGLTSLDSQSTFGILQGIKPPSSLVARH